MTNEYRSLGEGFAYFWWHVRTFPYSKCKGWGDMRNSCDDWWARGAR